MAAHDYHPALEGYAPEQVFHDGCGECEARGRDPELALAHIDGPAFTRAWRRAADFEASDPPSGVPAQHVSRAETSFLHLLWMVQLRLRELTGLPYGQLPSVDSSAYDAVFRDGS